MTQSIRSSLRERVWSPEVIWTALLTLAIILFETSSKYIWVQQIKHKDATQRSIFIALSFMYTITAVFYFALGIAWQYVIGAKTELDPLAGQSRKRRDYGAVMASQI